MGTFLPRFLGIGPFFLLSDHYMGKDDTELQEPEAGGSRVDASWSHTEPILWVGEKNRNEGEGSHLPRN